VAFFLNFVPILSPFCGIGLFLAVGLISKGPVWAALLPASLYFGISVLEEEIITPMLLANRFTIDPVTVILSLIFWYWIWGISCGHPGGADVGNHQDRFAIDCDRSELSGISWRDEVGQPRG
jgi:hypothetical protein